jgi:hypothetical protein
MILITTPHSFCTKTKNRTCDLKAETAAIELLNSLTKKGFVVFWLPANVDRSIIDLNRKNSRNVPWRKQLLNLLSNLKPSLIIDVHSFVPKYNPEFGKYNVVFPGQKPSNLVIFEGPNNYLNNISISNFLQKALKYPVRKNETCLDILVESAEQNIPGVLLEFNEDISGETIKQICEKLAQQFNQIINVNRSKRNTN